MTFIRKTSNYLSHFGLFKTNKNPKKYLYREMAVLRIFTSTF